MISNFSDTQINQANVKPIWDALEIAVREKDQANVSLLFKQASSVIRQDEQLLSDKEFHLYRLMLSCPIGAQVVVLRNSELGCLLATSFGDPRFVTVQSSEDGSILYISLTRDGRRVAFIKHPALRLQAKL